ncbi:MAG TPA: hypothetical protein VL309_12175 [Vicinamibacterales bacterium]|nr:hypothetical protein [Vicinamibacterales bacterium]
MPSAAPNDYRFVTRWRVEGTCGEVADVLGNPLSLAVWWPSVYLAVEEIRPPDLHGLGRRVALLTRGWLPYTLRWEFEVVDSRYPHGFTIEADGDFVGRGEWTFTQDGPFVEIVYDWRIRAEKPLLRAWSPVLKPLFEANHRWAMARGEESLRLELLRRRAAGTGRQADIPAPPGPVTYAGIALVAGAAAVGAGLAYLLMRASRGRRRHHHADEPLG